MASYDDINNRACAAYYRRTGVQPCNAMTDFNETSTRVRLFNVNGFLGEYRISDIPYTDRVRLSFVRQPVNA